MMSQTLQFGVWRKREEFFQICPFDPQCEGCSEIFYWNFTKGISVSKKNEGTKWWPKLNFQLLMARHRSPRKQQKSVLTLHWASSASKKNEETKWWAKLYNLYWSVIRLQESGKKFGFWRRFRRSHSMPVQNSELISIVKNESKVL